MGPRIGIMLGVVMAATGAAIGEVFQSPHGPGGSWHVYESIDQPATWAEAKQLASQRVWQGVAGTIVTIGSPAENALIEYLGHIVGQTTNWLGLTDREGAAPQKDGLAGIAPQESSSLSDPQSQGWAWTTGEPFSYWNWAPGEPRDFASSEDAVEMRPDGRWRDNVSGYGLDQPIVPVLQPGTSSNEIRSITRPYIVEYATAASAPFEDLPVLTAPPKMPPDLPGIGGGLGFLGVTDFRPAEVDEQIQASAALLIEIAQGRIVPSYEGQYPLADVTDPDARRHGGPVVDLPPQPIPSDVINETEENVISVAQGTVRVPEDGWYTIQVHHGGSFALQIGDEPFDAVGGDALLDETDRRTLYYSGTSAIPSSRGAIQLKRGDYPLRFYSASAGKGAFWEITSAQGVVLDDAVAQWLPLGSTDVLAEQRQLSPVRLSRPATVANVADGSGGQGTDLSDIRSVVEDAVLTGTALVRDDVTTLVLQDHDGICCNRPGADLMASQPFLWPINDVSTGGVEDAVDDFLSQVTGQLAVDDGDAVAGEWLDLTFGVFASDASQLHIDGASFSQGNFFAQLDQVVDGDVAITYRGTQTSNTDMLGLIQLQEGVTYDFDAVHYERQGDAGFEIWVAAGEHLAEFDPLAFSPLSTAVIETVISANHGLAFVGNLGDFDHNGVLDVGDLDRLANGIANQIDVPFDLNHDGQTDLDDQLYWLHELRRTWVGDANLDGEFTSEDIVEVFQAGRYANDEPANWSQGDWDGDQRFTNDDFVLAFQDGGYLAGPRAEAVPEPRHSVLILMGLAGTLWRRHLGR